MYYLAYGSNMDEDQMAHRCPGAKLIGTGRLHGFQLEFNRHATIVESENPDSLVPVAVWRITPDDELRLDRYEGYPSYYIKEEHTVRMSDGSEINGMIYRMKHIRKAPPTRAYYNAIAGAYHELGLGFEIELVLEPALKRALDREKRP